MIYELRIYHIKPDMMKEWIKLMEEKIIPFQKHCGMKIIASFVGTQDRDLYIWLRVYENENERSRLYDKVYGSGHWKDVVRPLIGDMLIREKTEVIMMESVSSSILTWDL